MAIITISPQMGTGGIPIAQQVAEELDYTLINGDAIKAVAADYGLTEEALLLIDEKPPAFIENLDRQLELDTCRMQLIILEKAYEGNAILYGRGGQYLLPGIRSVFRVRIIAPFEERVERWAEREWIDPDLAHSLVRKSDQRRAGYIKYYFDSDWENTINYDMIINTSRVSNDSAARLIKEATRDPYLIEKSEKCKVRIKDLIIQKKVQIARLADERIKDIWFKIDVQDCCVTLAGHVYSEEERRAAIDDARKVEGVIEVVDNLKIVHY